VSSGPDLLQYGTLEHGTRKCYVTGCRCAPCRGANNARYRARVKERLERAGEAVPSGPPLESFLIRAGRWHKVKRCPGANGAPCVRVGGSWLRDSRVQVCQRCVERVTIFDGRVDPKRAREHLRALSRVGVGYKAVAEACDVSHTTLNEIISGEKTTIRASTERKILRVDAGARADHALVAGARTNRLIAAMVRRGFTRTHLARLLGYAGPALQIGSRKHAAAITEARVVRLYAKVVAGAIAPERVLQSATEERAWVNELLRLGVDAKWLTKRIGFHITKTRSSSARMFPENVERVRAFRAELEQLLRHGDVLPAEWKTSPRTLSGIGVAFGFGPTHLVPRELRARFRPKLSVAVSALLRTGT
jgi:hypothetical protein